MSQQQYALEKLQKIQTRIREAALSSGRRADSIRLVGACKKQNPQRVAAFVEAGLTDLGENYLQEGIAKQAALSAIRPHDQASATRKTSWHFIGQIQSNKTKLIAQYFSWVHGVDRLKIAARLAAHNPHSHPIKLLIQLNLDHEESKGGVLPAAAAELADQISQQLSSTDNETGGAQLHGFMAIPMAKDSEREQCATFAIARELLETSNQRYGLQLSELSMGMSGDLAAAIAEGATMVRIGTDLFGART